MDLRIGRRLETGRRSESYIYTIYIKTYISLLITKKLKARVASY